jgi:hypothetical protein
MPRTIPVNLFHQLALAVAAGRPVSTWCEASGVATRTAYAWYRQESFRRLVAEYRRRAEERAIGEMAKGLGKAVAKVVQLIEEGSDDHVKLSAAETLIDKMLQVQGRAELKAEIRRLDERLAAQEEWT